MLPPPQRSPGGHERREDVDLARGRVPRERSPRRLTACDYAFLTVEPILAIAVCVYLAVVAVMSLAFWEPPDPR